MVAVKKPHEKAILEEAKEALEVVETPEINDKEKELTDRLQRLQAEFTNFQRRTELKKHENLINANENLISELLVVLDHFELSLKHNKDKGIALIYDDLNKILEKQGLKIIDTKGKFNPEFHEALIQEEGKKEGIILEEFQKGYLLNDKLLRASKVKISKIISD
jgi:molecular chaperone GrpE